MHEGWRLMHAGVAGGMPQPGMCDEGLKSCCGYVAVFHRLFWLETEL